jgi:hypothetical protein
LQGWKNSGTLAYHWFQKLLISGQQQNIEKISTSKSNQNQKMQVKYYWICCSVVTEHWDGS